MIQTNPNVENKAPDSMSIAMIEVYILASFGSRVCRRITPLRRTNRIRPIIRNVVSILIPTDKEQCGIVKEKVE